MMKVKSVSRHSSTINRRLLFFYGAMVVLLVIYLALPSAISNLGEEGFAYPAGDTAGKPLPDPGLQAEDKVDDDGAGFLVNTPYCHIPDLDPYHSSVKRIIEKNLKPVKCDVERAFVTYTLGTTLYTHRPAWNKLHKAVVSCCYKSVHRKNNLKSDDAYQYVFFPFILQITFSIARNCIFIITIHEQV